MGFVEALLLALALCVDSLVVSTTTAFRTKMTYRRGLLMAFIFGLCQGAFPLAGALIGDVAREFIEAVDHWIAFGLLAFIGGKMIIESSKECKECKECKGVQDNSNVSPIQQLGMQPTPSKARKMAVTNKRLKPRTSPKKCVFF